MELKTISETLIAGDAEKLISQVESALDLEITAKEILNDALIAGMDIVGERM